MADTALNTGYPLTPVQEGMLFNAERAPGSGVDVVHVLCTVDAALEAGRLEEAWQALARAQPLLRTSYVSGEAVESPAGTAGVGFAAVDWRGMTAQARDEALDRFLDADRRKGFTLSEPPLIRLTLAREQDGVSTLIVTLHHILLDGWSYPILLEDLLTTYESGGAPARGAFRSYVGWLGTADHAASHPFWRTYLDGFSDPTPLPHEGGTFAPGGGYATYGRVERLISAADRARLRALAEASGARLSTLFRAAWGLLLTRYAGRDEAVFGETRACRRAPVEGIAVMPGCFINTVPACVRVSPDARVAGWLTGLEAAHAPVREYERTPLASIRSWLGAPGDMPLFESLFVYNSRSTRSVMQSRRAPPRVTRCSVLSHTNFPLVLEVDGEVCGMTITYDRRRFSAGTASRFAENLARILCALPHAPRVGEVPAMTDAEERMILRAWNDTGSPSRPPRCVHELVAEQALRTPGAVAVRCGAERLTYGDLERQSAALARGLAALGAGRGSVVGIALERSCSMMVALLGVMRSGAAYLPLDVTLPRERLRFMASDASCRLILTSAATGPRLAGLPGRIVDIGSVPEGGEVHSRGPGPDDPAYIMYTSGSTGTPKGIVLLHRGLANYVTWSAQAYPFTEGSGSLVHTSISFDLTITGLYPPLACGREVEFLPEHAGPGDLAGALLRRPGYGVVKLTPAHLDLLTALIPAGRAGGLARALVIGGSQLMAESLRRWRSEAPGTALYNEYGPTESVVGCCVYRVPEDHPDSGPVPIGRPIANTRLYITDARLRPLPLGATGELCIGGEGVAAGYLNRTDQSAAKFIPDPFSGAEGAHLYRSGDRARYLPDGTIEYIGRADDQVKVRGYRVEPGEIEAVLMAQGLLRDVAVLAREDASGECRLEAFCVAATPAGRETEALRAHARRFLPAYMVPSAFVFLDTLPLTPRGKVDRRVLAAHAVPAGVPGAAHLLAGTEASVAAIWQDLLGVSDIGPGDNFFERGGHSLLVMRLLARIHAQWNVEIRISEVFAAPTVPAIASLIERRLPEEPAMTAGDGELSARKGVPGA